MIHVEIVYTPDLSDNPDNDHPNAIIEEPSHGD